MPHLDFLTEISCNTAFAIFYPLIGFLLKKSGFTDSDIKLKQGYIEDFEPAERVIMFHGVSVGEINAIEKLVKKTRAVFPDTKLVVTAGTNTGKKNAEEKLGGTADLITYFPFDTPCCVKRFLDRVKPADVLMAETEIWPNFLNECSKYGARIYIINGRISDRTFNSYKIFKFFFKKILKKYTGIFTQSTEDLEKFLSLGADPKTTKRMNNLKFDITAPEVDINFEKIGRVFLAASTHSGEDKIILDTYKRLRLKHPDLKLVIAPRHLTRLEEVKSIIGEYCLRSEGAGLKDFDIMILDTMGELGKLFYFADISFIGGSFNKTGGHNPLEAVIFGKPVISGSSINNFKDIYAIIQKAKAGFVVKNPAELLGIADKLLSDKKFYDETSENGINVFKEQQGALDFVTDVLKNNP